MTGLLTRLASVFHRHPLPGALHSPCKGVTIVSMCLCGSREFEAPKLNAITEQGGPVGVGGGSLVCQVLVGKEDLGLERTDLS